MADTYSTLRDRLIAQYQARGVPYQKAVEMAQKRASAQRLRGNPGDTKSHQGRQVLRKKAPPVPKQKKKLREDEISDFIMEVHGITGLMGQAPAAQSTTLAPAGSGSTSSATPAASAGKEGDTKDPQKGKTGRSGAPSNSFKTGAGPKASIEKAKPGQVALRPKTMESIEKEFGIK